jgi:hypothetical protein
MSDNDIDNIPWLMSGFTNDIPKESMPFVRTVHLNKKSEGCYICGRKTRITRHHIRKGRNPLAVYICRKHHDIIHGIALGKKYDSGRRKGSYYYSDADLRMVLSVAEEFNLFKHGERGIVTKRIRLELQKRDAE